MVGAGSRIGRWARISTGVILDDEVRVYDGVFITKDASILPARN